MLSQRWPSASPAPKNMGDCQNWKKHLRHIWRLPPRELCQARGSFMGWLFHSTAIPRLCRLIMRAAPQNKEPLISHVWVYYAFSYFSQMSGWWVMRVEVTQYVNSLPGSHLSRLKTQFYPILPKICSVYLGLICGESPLATPLGNSSIFLQFVRRSIAFKQ